MSINREGDVLTLKKTTIQTGGLTVLKKRWQSPELNYYANNKSNETMYEM